MLYFVGQKPISPSTFRMFLRPKNREFREAFPPSFSNRLSSCDRLKTIWRTTGFRAFRVSASITTP